jgi:Ribonuclease G/E
MTRKRTRESLERTLCETCSTCQGRGTVKSAEKLRRSVGFGGAVGRLCTAC